MDDKEALIAAMLLKGSADSFKQSMDSAVDVERTKAQTATMELNRLRLETERGARANADEKSRLESLHSQQTEEELRKVKAQNLSLTTRLNNTERALAGLRATTRDWVASQRGCLALAKALRMESQTCPHQEHHVLGGMGSEAEAARDKIAEDAADKSLATNEADTIVMTKIPAYVPLDPVRIQKKAK